DRGAQAADGIARAVKEQRGGRAAREFAVDVYGGRVDDIARVRHRGDRLGALIDRAVHHRVRVRVNDAGRDELARRVNDARAFGRFQVLPDGCDLSAAYEIVGVLKRAVRSGQDRRVAYERVGGRRRARLRAD